MDADTQKILDGLDRRLALGEIDIGTYNTLKAKFSVQPNKLADPVAGVVAAMAKEAVALSCPGCMAPLPAPKDPSAYTLVCEYCGSTCTLQTAKSEMEELKAGMRKWVAELAGGAGLGTTVDEASRSFIFKERLLPSLKLAANRATEIYAFSRHQCLFAFPLVERLASSPFRDAVSGAPNLGSLVEKIKGTIARVQAPEVQAFAIGAAEKSALSGIEVQCQETIYLSNARRHLASYSEDGFQKAISNLGAVDALYSKTSQHAGNTDATAAKFSEALSQRVKNVAEAIKVVQELFAANDGLMTEQIAARIDGYATNCEQAATMIEQSGREPKETVPAAEGTRNDAQTMRLLSHCVRLFGHCGAETGQAFRDYLATLEQIVERVKEPQAGLTWLSDLLSRIYLHVESTVGERALPMFDRFDWLDGRILAEKKSSLFGGTESADVEQKVLLPFWMARICSSQQTGLIFKKGQATESLLFLDAGRRNGECVTLGHADPMTNDIRQVVKDPKRIGASRMALVPVVTAETATKRLKSMLASKPEFAGSYADIQDLVYLPVAVVKFATKKAERRQVMMPAAGAQLNPFQVATLNLGSRKVSVMQ